jgi:hypothetical protein
MCAVISEVVAAILATSIPATAMAKEPLETPMIAIAGGSYALYHSRFGFVVRYPFCYHH